MAQVQVVRNLQVYNQPTNMHNQQLPISDTNNCITPQQVSVSFIISCIYLVHYDCFWASHTDPALVLKPLCPSWEVHSILFHRVGFAVKPLFVCMNAWCGLAGIWNLWTCPIYGKHISTNVWTSSCRLGNPANLSILGWYPLSQWKISCVRVCLLLSGCFACNL